MGLVIIGSILCVIGILMIVFNSPGSKTKAEFTKTAESLIAEAGQREDIFKASDIAGLPEPVQRYFIHCGYIGTPKMSYIKMTYHDVDFVFDNDRALKIDYTQYNFVDEPNRLAYIDSGIYGIPFEGLDMFVDGTGSMKGVLAKVFTLFNQTGRVMDESSLVTFLSESLLVSDAALQNYIRWEAIDTLHAKATISYYGMTVSGIFTFNETGEMLSFQTEDRMAVTSDGAEETVTWSVVCGEYVEENGIKKPTRFQAIWHYDAGDLIYFDGEGVISGYH